MNNKEVYEEYYKSVSGKRAERNSQVVLEIAQKLQCSESKVWGMIREETKRRVALREGSKAAIDMMVSGVPLDVIKQTLLST